MNYDIFIDESCHLEHDNFPVMAIGYIKVAKSDYEKIKEDIKQIKLKHNSKFELKWNKISNSRLQLYNELIKYFFNSSSLNFRCVLVKYKNRLDHNQFNQGSHDNFYYKMIYYLLRPNNNNGTYRVYLDIKDTWGRVRLKKIKEVFRNYYKNKSPFVHFQHIRSHESEFIQLADLFIGAITYKARGEHKKENANQTKLKIVEYIEELSGYHIDEGTELWEEKFNIFAHQPKRL